MINAGELKNLITIEKPVETEGDYGETIKTWEQHCQCWSNIQNLRGDEYWAAKASESEATGEIKIRYRDDITEDMRVKFNSRVFEIDAYYDPFEERKELQLIVKEQL